MTAPALDAIVGAPSPVIVPGLLRALGITQRTVPAWITNPNLIDDILAGHAEIPADFGGDTHTDRTPLETP